MQNKNNKKPSIEFKHTGDKFSMEAAEELRIPNLSDGNLTTAKILYAYELGLKNKL